MSMPTTKAADRAYCQLDALALRLILAHLEESALDRDLHRELVRADSGMSDGQFHIVDSITWLYARMVQRSDRDAVRAEFVKFLQDVTA
jgi:hypothetical protein